MKKSIGLLLGLMLVMSFALVSCGDEVTVATEGATTTAVTTAAPDTTQTTEVTFTAVDWTEAADYEESEAVITGTIVAVDNLLDTEQIPKILVRLGGDSTTDHFNIVVQLDEDGTILFESITTDMLNALVGQTVEISGVVTANVDESVYEMYFTDPSQLVVK